MEITNHAINRYLERTLQVQAAKEKISAIVEKGKEIVPSPRFSAMKLMNNRYEDAKYLEHGGLIAVVVDEKVITVHRRNAKEWIDKPIAR